MIVGVVVLIVVNIIALSISSHRRPLHGPGRIVIYLIAPFQKAVTNSIRFVKGVWEHYFFLVKTAQENDRYRKALGKTRESANRCRELKLANDRLRDLLHFKKKIHGGVVAAEVIARDTSAWFKAVIIDKGEKDTIKKGMAVVVSEGIVGQVVDVSTDYSKVLLMIDHNSSIDAMVRRTRARGVVLGESARRCQFNYVLRKNDVEVGDIVISSGLDGVYPKGLVVGNVVSVVKRSYGIFQEVTLMPGVDFEKLEEVLVILNSPVHKFVK